MHNDRLFEYVKKKFEEEGECEGCGSQRCDGSFEWMSACPKFQSFFYATIHPPIIFDDKKLKRLFEDIKIVDNKTEE